MFVVDVCLRFQLFRPRPVTHVSCQKTRNSINLKKRGLLCFGLVYVLCACVMINMLQSLCYHLVQNILVSKKYTVLLSKINVNIVTIL